MIASMAQRDNPQEVALGQRIASNIQALLRSRRLTQGQLAAYAELPQSSISALIIGRRNPSLLSIWKVSQALGVPLEELAGFKPLQIPEAPQQRPDADRLGSLEGQFREMQAQLQQLTDALGDYVEQKSPQKSTGTRKRAS